MNKSKNKKTLIVSLAVSAILLFLSAIYQQKNNSSIPVSSTQPQPENKNNSFIILGDTGTGWKSQYDVADAVDKFCMSNTCRAAFIVGDVIYGENGISTVEDEQFKTKFEDPYNSIHLPFYIGLGNHDYLGCTHCYSEYDQRSDKWHMPSRYYLVNFEEATFYIIDTENFDGEQQNWLRQSLTGSATPWNIVIGHRPLETNEISHHGELWSGIKELESIVCNDAQLYISGHAHVLEDIGPIENCTVRQLISGGGGASIRSFIPQKQSDFSYAGYGFLYLKVTEKTVTYGFIRSDNKLLYQAYSNL